MRRLRHARLVRTDKAPEPAMVVIGNPSHPIVKLFLADGTVTRNAGDDLPVGQGLIDGLQPLLAQAPTLVKNAVHAMGTSIVMRFAPEAAKGLSDGSLTLMRSLEGGFRATAVDSGNKIVAQGSLKIVSNANPAFLAIAVWQVLAIITAQKYLSDINKKLSRINTAVEDIKEWLENDRWSRLVSDIKYVTRVANRLNNQDVTELDIHVVLSELESIERQTSQVCEAIRGQFRSLSGKYERLNLDGIGLHDHTQEAKKVIDEYNRQTRTFLAATFLRGNAAQIRAALPTNRSLALDRVNCVRDDVQECHDGLAAFERLVERRLPELKGTFSFSDTDEKCRNQVREHLEAFLKETRLMCVELRDTAQDVTDKLHFELKNARFPVLLAVSVDEKGTISRVQRLRHDKFPSEEEKERKGK